MKQEIKKIEKVLEKFEFEISSNEKQDDDFVIEFGQYTPLGEDWYVCLFYDGSYNNFKEKLTEYAENFDIDEEAEIWIENRGKNGTPNSIKDLVEDAEWKKEKLQELSESL